MLKTFFNYLPLVQAGTPIANLNDVDLEGK